MPGLLRRCIPTRAFHCAAGHEGDVVADVKTLPPAVSRVLACCQSLLQVEKGLVGDPVEKASVEATGGPSVDTAAVK